MRPDRAVTVTTYQELFDDVKRFVDGKYNCLVIVGNPGSGKTETVRQALKGRPSLVYGGGAPTPFKFYCDLYERQDCPVVLDDVPNSFYTNSVTNAWLKNLMDTRKKKTLRWTSSALDDTDIPNVFQTESRFCILTNDWGSAGPHVEALSSRSTILVFDPPFDEVHKQVGTWFGDKVVYDWMFEHRRFCMKPDMRLYARIGEQRAAGAPWEKRGFEMIIGSEKLRMIAEIIHDPNYQSNNQKAKRFVELGWGSRATYYRLVAEYKRYQAVQLTESPALNPKPIEPQSDDEDSFVDSMDDEEKDD